MEAVIIVSLGIAALILLPIAVGLMVARLGG